MSDEKKTGVTPENETENTAPVPEKKDKGVPGKYLVRLIVVLAAVCVVIAALLATVNALFGGVLFTSDNVGTYDEKKRAFYERLEALGPRSVVDIKSRPGKLLIRYREGSDTRTLTVPTK